MTKIAFALGGLAGNNAHGAGFLDAALDLGVQPDMISCTSGQILWVYRYLIYLGEAKNYGEKKRMKQYLKEDIASVQPTGNVNVDLALLCTFGKAGVFRPARSEYWGDFFENCIHSCRNIATRPLNVNLAQELRQILPCRVLVPAFPTEFFRKISDEFNAATDIGIVFNSYDPRSGDENVYMNPKAQKSLKRARGERDAYRDRITYCEIDDQAVQDALWLYEYGFDKKRSEFVDGAYFRGMMLSELTDAEVIYAVRPINHHWQGRMPRNEPDMADMKTEIGFDGSYCGERYQIRLINKMLKNRTLDAALSDKYHPITLKEIEIERPRGFFDYLFESMDVFEDAYTQGLNQLKEM